MNVPSFNQANISGCSESVEDLAERRFTISEPQNSYIILFPKQIKLS